jgi:hypothetical protein
MIYLIDDTSLESLNATFLLAPEYQSILRFIKTVDELDSFRSELSSAECIMIHRTFANSSIYKEQMAELTNDGDTIPFVVFSAGDSERAVFDEKYPQIIEGIKKSVFYSRLPYFLETFELKHEINLNLLAYGKDYIKIRVRSLALSVLRVIAAKEGEINVSELANIASCSEFKELVSLSYPAIGFSYDELLEELEDNPISFEKFKNNINQIVNSFYQYGKNIYLWQ